MLYVLCTAGGFVAGAIAAIVLMAFLLGAKRGDNREVFW